MSKEGTVKDLAKKFAENKLNNAEFKVTHDTSGDDGLQQNSKARMNKGMLSQFERNLQREKVNIAQDREAKRRQEQLDQDYVMALMLQEEYYKPEYQ